MQSGFDPKPYLDRLENLVDVNHVLAAEARQTTTREYRPAVRSWGTEAYFVETLARRYPRLKQVVRVGCPDSQRPFDLASIIVGTDLFLAVIECPDLVRQLLAFLTEVYIAFMRRQRDPSKGIGYTFMRWTLVR